MAGTVGLSCVFMLMLALEKGWYQVAVTKVMTGIGISDCWNSGWHIGILFLLWCGISENAVSWRCLQLNKESQMMEGTTLGAVRELLSKCMAVGRATGVDGLLDWGPYQFRGLYDAWNCRVLVESL